MKKLLLFSLFTAIISLGAYAQTTVQITSAGDTTWGGSVCTTPATVQFYVNGSVSGYDPAVDSADVYINFGDGSDTIIRTSLWSGNNSLLVWQYAQHTYTSPGWYSTQYIITMPDNNADTLSVQNEIIISDTCGNINGRAYIDNNNNCIYDAGTDNVLHFAAILLKDSLSGTTLQWTYTDINGYYWFSAPTSAALKIELSNNVINHYTVTCPTNAIYYVNASAGNLDFAVECMNGFDLEANGFGAGFVPGTSTGHVYLSGWNNRCLPTSGQMMLVSSDPLLTYSHSWYNAPDAISGDTLIWNFSNLSQQSYWSWWSSYFQGAHFYTDTTAQIGDTLCFELIVTPSAGDEVAGNNSVTFCSPVVASYDPNNKVVSPLGKGPDGNIQPGQQLTYTINFQNTGTAPAMNIFLLDTLDLNVLDIRTLKITGSSHQITGSKLLNGNVIKFNFDGINLPDSLSNEPGSHGWITYVVDQIPNLSHGVQIKNQAGIYFDWNPVVETNWTLNTIDTGNAQVYVKPALTADQLAYVFPNPASSQLYISLSKMAEDAEYMLFDLRGKLLQRAQLTSDLKIIDLNGYNSGLYMLIINASGQVQYQKIGITR